MITIKYRALLLALLYGLSVHGNKIHKATPGFAVSGTTIYDAAGNPFIMRGLSYMHTWFKDDLEAAIPAIEKTDANIVRVVLANGVQWDKDDAESVEKIISLLSENKMIAMLEVHDATGSDEFEALDSAVDYWIELSSVLQGKEDRVIINIANEWYSKDNAEAWADAYKTVVKRLRDAGFVHLLVIDAAGWGQYPDVIPAAGPAIFKADSLSNIVFSIHMYAVAGKDPETVKKNIDDALAVNIPVIIGEFADMGTGEHVDVESIIAYTQETSVGWLAWSWYGNTDPALDLVTSPTGNLTAYGERVINGKNGLKETSVRSAIFD